MIISRIKVHLRRSGKLYWKISREFRLLVMACYQAIKYIEHHRTSTTLPCKAGPLKTDGNIHKLGYTNKFAFDEKMYIRHHIDEEYHKGCLKETIRCRSGSVLHLNPDLNPIEMLWIDMNKHVKKQELKNINELYARIEEAWCLIPITDGVDAFDLSNLCHAEYARNLQKTKLLCVVKYANT
ncbi:hypothetical protein HZH66_013677 [Vespula vulgaris]|uniref:Uncharacterized protein n=1 Tax=Vespula vulgaris TaxID=7454 RepID=A0A834MRA5_VESVU|nr:hypothetical protein HZH66_013677 [Vespula vulgaris]